MQLFPGVTATVEASGLPPNRELELWLAPAFDYFYAALLGGILLDTSAFAGTVTTAADGTLSEPLTVPAGVVFDTSYRLFAGDAEDRYWPAGTYRSFTITSPLAEGTAPVDVDDTEASVPLASTSVDFVFPAGTAGTWSAAVSTTGPVVNQFSLAGDVPLYYHLDYSESLGGAEVEVCITYSVANIPGDPPRLFHFAPVEVGAFQWADITTSQAPGKVCGVTTSFSPFALGYPDEFDFSGFFDPVSMDAPNLANPGQAIPVKFSLDGDQGLDVIESARFVSHGTVANPTGELVDSVAASRSQLSYNATNDQYTYVWKTLKAWSKQTGEFVLTLSDGTTHSFDVTFKK